MPDQITYPLLHPKHRWWFIGLFLFVLYASSSFLWIGLSYMEWGVVTTGDTLANVVYRSTVPQQDQVPFGADASLLQVEFPANVGVYIVQPFGNRYGTAADGSEYREIPFTHEEKLVYVDDESEHGFSGLQTIVYLDQERPPIGEQTFIFTAKQAGTYPIYLRVSDRHNYYTKQFTYMLRLEAEERVRYRLRYTKDVIRRTSFEKVENGWQRWVPGL